jgi:hypothetical protein
MYTYMAVDVIESHKAGKWNSKFHSSENHMGIRVQEMRGTSMVLNFWWGPRKLGERDILK